MMSVAELTEACGYLLYRIPAFAAGDAQLLFWSEAVFSS